MSPGDSLPAASAAAPAESGLLTAAEHLTLAKVADVAATRLRTVTEDALLVEVAALLASAQISAVLVCNASGAALGIITETLLIRHLGLGRADFFATRAGAVMQSEFVVCALGDSLRELLNRMQERGLIHAFLLDADRKPLGVLTLRDGLRALLATGEREEQLLRDYVMGVGYQ